MATTIYYPRGQPIARTKIDSTDHFGHPTRGWLGEQVYSVGSTPPVIPPVIGNPASILIMGY